MTQLRSLRSQTPRRCPHCNSHDSFTVLFKKLQCVHCGYVAREEDFPNGMPQTEAQPAPVAVAPGQPMLDRTQYKPSYFTSMRGTLEPFVEAAFHTAVDYLKREEWDQAIAAFERCVDYRRDFVDAYLWLARLVQDPAKQRDYLTSVLAYEPNHGEALRDLMILNGELSYNDKLSDGAPEIRKASEPVTTKTVNVRCPRCGSPRLTDDDASGELYCDSCGHRQPKPEASSGYNSLSQTMIKRRAQPVRWVVGSRLLHCHSCGAERTIPAEKLSEHCPFCGSRNVIEEDALGSFQQPDGIIPFAITEQNALKLMQEQLQSWGEKLKGWVSDNRVKRTDIAGVFLPFWVFDVMFETTRTTIDNRARERRAKPYVRETFPDMKPNVMIPAVAAPPKAMTTRLGKYAIGKAVKYQPKMLAQHAAEIYTTDVEKAAMDVHEIVAEDSRTKYQRMTGSSEVKITVSTMVKNMTFQLLLVPVWSVTIFEKDGDVRPVLVNGQSGRVVLGKAKKPGK